MHFTTSVLAAILAFTSASAASPFEARAKALQDWQVSSVSVFTPSGRPESYPWATIVANVTDPNEIHLGNASSDGSPVIVPAGSQGIDCEARYYIKGDTPLGRSWPCNPTDKGYWTMQVLAGTNGYSSTDFKLKFLHVADVLYQGSEYTAGYQSTGSFKVGDNLAGVCGGSGVCSWGLVQGKNPVRIKVTKV